jgi:hypothetical protein
MSSEESDRYFETPRLGNGQMPEARTVTYWQLMMIPRWSMGAIGAFISYFVMTFYEPILAIRLDDFHLST